MSVANSLTSSIVTNNTVVGSRNLSASASEVYARNGDDAVSKRDVCLLFERKLDLSKYLRDKNNEERTSYARFVRINSKRLQCSYQIPAEDVFSLLQNLADILAPGQRAEALRKSTGRKLLDLDDELALKTFTEWISCVDFTAQVIPKAPTVLWLDLECMTCKSGRGKQIDRHFGGSKRIIEIVIGAVFNFLDTRSQSGEFVCSQMYVTRGKTCGMHLFFPQITIHTEDDMQDLWACVNKRLIEEDLPMATVDTGCSAMPLPLARDHNGLTRVKITRTDGGKIFTQSYRMCDLKVKELARITNFYHFVADEKRPQESAAKRPAEVNDRTTTTTETIQSVQTPDRNGVDEKTLPRAETRLHETAVRDTPDGISTVSIEHNDGAIDTNMDVSVERSPTDERSVSAETDVREGFQQEMAEEDVILIDDCDDNERCSSVSSTSSISKRLVQSDIRKICAKANGKKRTSQEGSQTTSVVKRRKTTETDDIETVSRATGTRQDDDTASSFICKAHTPSLKSERLTDSETSKQNNRRDGGTPSTSAVDNLSRATTSVSRSAAGADERPAHALYVSDESLPPNASIPRLYYRPIEDGAASRNGKDYMRQITRAKYAFEQRVKLALDSHENQTHETDIQLIVSSFNAEMNFYKSIVADTTFVSGVEYDGLRLKKGCSLYDSRENCPPAMFPENIPFVLYTEDFVTEAEWTAVLVRYFDEYLNTAPFLYVLLQVLEKDANVQAKLSVLSRCRIKEAAERCLARFKRDVIAYQREHDVKRRNRLTNVPKHPYEEKCVVATGLLAVCSLAFKLVTPIFTDLVKACRIMSGTNQQTLDSLNSSTMSASAGEINGCSYDTAMADHNDDCLFDESVSQVGNHVEPAETAAGQSCDETFASRRHNGKGVAADLGNEHSILASLLRWNYPTLENQTLWCLFFYYYHVHADALSRIIDEVLHGGLMVTALLQAFFENCSNNGPIDVRTVCNQVYDLNERLIHGDGDRSLMPPPNRRTGLNNKTKKKGGNSSGGVSRGSSPAPKEKRRHEDAKVAQRKIQNAGRSDWDEDSEDNEAGCEDRSGSNKIDYLYQTSFREVLALVVNHYLRPVTFDETTLVFTEGGYEPSQHEYASVFSSDKDRKRLATDVFNRSTIKYSMPHGDLLLYNTDIMGVVHRRSTCSNNLILNIFENMYGGCITYLTRRFNNHLKLFNRFNGDAYRLAVECRHAINEFVRSIELSYVNLILRQPIVPPVLEADITVRHMFMSDDEILKGAFVCLNTMDYVRSINMFTGHSNLSRENCKGVELFLDKVITEKDVNFAKSDEIGRTVFRTVYLFYLLYIFEVLYKIRHTYNRDSSYRVSFERLSWEIDIRVLLKLFFGSREFKTPRGLSPDVLQQLGLPADLYNNDKSPVSQSDDGFLATDSDNKTAASRCINTRPLVSADLPDKMSRMMELFGKKGIHLMKSYAPLFGGGGAGGEVGGQRAASECEERRAEGSTHSSLDDESCSGTATYEERDRAFLDMTQANLEQELYSSAKWYDNCRARVKAVRNENREETRSGKRSNAMDTSMDAASMDTFLRTQLRVNIDNDRLNHIEEAVRQKVDFAFCTHLPLRAKMIALVLATHTAKRLTTDVAGDFVRKEYQLERSGVIVLQQQRRDGSENATDTHIAESEDAAARPDQKWEITWNRLLSRRTCLLVYCRRLADTNFPNNYFVGLHPDDTYHALYHYMLSKSKYATLHALQKESWAKDVCSAFNYLLTINAYDPELVELCLRLFLGFEWPGQWAKRIFVWKSNSNAGKSFFFDHVIRKAFDQSTCINDPRGGKDNAPEKSEYYRNFVLMINEFTSASAAELKKLCSTSSYKFRMNFGNQMIQAFMVGKMVFNCNTLPLTTDHATIQRVALVPLRFWFQKRQTVVDSMLNWTRGQAPSSDYEKNFRRNISEILTKGERKFFLGNLNTRNEDDLFNRPTETSLKMLSELRDQNARAPMFLVQSKTSQVYMQSVPHTGAIISGIVTITRYFCRFRFFNSIKEPVDYSVLPTACNAAAQEWQRISQPYFDWKERYRVHTDYYVRTKVSTIHASINHYAKTAAKNVSFFDLQQFFEWDFAEQKIPYYSAQEDEYNVRIDPLDD